MKVLMVSEDLPAKSLGGLGKHVVTLGNALIAAGHDVALMGRNDVAYAECAKEIGFHGPFIPGFGNPFPGWKEAQLGFFNPWKRPHVARQIAKAIRAHAGAFDVVHYHGHHPMVGRHVPASVNFVQTRHDQGSECITHVRFRQGAVCIERAPEACAGCAHAQPGRLRTLLSAAAVRRYRAETAEAFARHPVVFVSHFLQANVLKAMPQAQFRRAEVIHNFIDEDALQAIRAKPVTGHPGFRIHVAGRLDAPKGIAALLAQLAPRMPQSWSVDVYGDGPLRSALLDAHTHGAIRLHGHTPHQDVLCAARQANVVVVPSEWEEPCSTVALEAMNLGKTCYALDKGGTPELARYGVRGQLRLFKSLPLLVDALLRDGDSGNSECGEGEKAGVSEATASLCRSLFAQAGIYMRDPGTGSADRPRFSIVTVCFNAAAVLPETVASLRAQACKDYEWIVVDGASTDGSADWLRQQHPDVFVSEPDKGIFDAMNKAVALARGQWVFFLNAGDRLADPDTLADVSLAIDAAPLAALIYGDVVLFGRAGKRRKRFHWLTRGRLLFGDLCHQAAFSRRSLFDTCGLFDTSLRFNADFDWFIRVFNAGATLHYMQRDVAHFHDAGAHVVAADACLAERNVVRARYLKRPMWTVGHVLLRAELKLRRLIGQAT